MPMVCLGPCLGKGGFAKVYLAKSSKTRNERVAIKVVPRKRISKPEQEQKIENEIEIQSTCCHKNILQLLSHWSDPEKICLVLEYCPNRTLSHLLKLSPIRRVPEDASVEIIYQVIDAVSYLHSHGIIHRDIKLGNILLNRRVAKLADFGLAIKYHTTEQVSHFYFFFFFFYFRFLEANMWNSKFSPTRSVAT
jgi:polo-like kinase 1